MNTMFRALRHHNFKLFVEGQSLSLIGTWIQRIAVNWLTYELTGSMFWLGAVNFAGSIPFFFIAPLGGIMADRWSKHKILLITQSLALVQALVFAGIYFADITRIWEILILNFILGVISAIDMPVRQSFVHEMVDNDKEDLSNAIAMNSTMVNTARLVGPSIAGILIATAGEGWCFLLNSLSFVAVVISLLKMKITYVPKQKKKRRVVHEFMEGAKYSFTSIPVKYLLFMMIVMGLASTALPTLAPAFAEICLNGNAETYGFLIGAWGIGALFSAVYLLNRRSVLGMERLIAVALVAFGVSVVAFSLSSKIIIAMIFMATSGIGLLLNNASTNTLLQTVSENEIRGRVMSFYAMCNKGMSPIGAIITGYIGDLIGVKYTLAICGIVCIMSAIIYTTKMQVIKLHVIRKYRKKG
ncbi:MAG: hypothetical protein A2X47_03025 [Lentisphaerae bacterium GWF2_38_69]|nr:MAG: hypothetical protein A2X47_03025 [Lentisphaerae bacterium GWF2_38_69]